ncbi:Tetratricopeptide TPR_1 repeat-containing protein [uncultured Paludibacter sp.]|nr:Tetratricopeptide TPR_1 repeat-containing protein [uncultured Paludibacter sp.]
MKKLFLYIYIILFATFSLSAQNTVQDADVLKQANEFYKQGNYSDAAKIYESELKKGFSAELYYNLGNAYFKSNEIGLSILNYERALRLKPDYKDAEYNLNFAKQKVVDNLGTTPSFFVKRWAISVLECFTSNQWAVISIIAFVVTLILLLLFAFSRERSRRKVSFYAAFVSIFLTLAAFTLSGVRKDQMLKHRDAIIMNGAVTVKSSPDKSGTDLFQLHEGTKVRIKSTLTNWAEIEVENGAIGWIEESTMERI